MYDVAYKRKENKAKQRRNLKETVKEKKILMLNAEHKRTWYSYHKGHDQDQSAARCGPSNLEHRDVSEFCKNIKTCVIQFNGQ